MVNDSVEKFGLVDTSQINKLLAELKRRREEDDLINGITNNTKRHEVIKAYNILKKERKNKRKGNLINFLNKASDLRRSENEDVVDTDDIMDDGDTLNIDGGGTPFKTPIITRGSKAQHHNLISRFFNNQGINKKDLKINGKKFNFTYFDLVNDLISNRKTLNLKEHELRSILPELKRKGMPISYIKNKIREMYINSNESNTTGRRRSSQIPI